MIQSIMENASDKNEYHLFILHRNISDENMHLLKAQMEAFRQFSIEFININEYIKDYDFYFKVIPIETYFSLLIPYLFADYKKVIYLDCDMICCTDVAALYQINIDNYILAATKDVLAIRDWYVTIHKQKLLSWLQTLKIKNVEDYFMCGTVIYNIEQFHNNITMSLEELLIFAVSRKWIFQEQDVLNYLCHGKVLFLTQDWNLVPCNFINKVPDTLRTEYHTAEKQPKIVHYAADNKPWKAYAYKLYFEMFWKYATRIPFSGIIIERMYEKKFVGTSLTARISFDFCTAARYFINWIRRYIPV
jgi:lipopolysaccharide biosynthesis glycosyltransferase